MEPDARLSSAAAPAAGRVAGRRRRLRLPFRGNRDLPPGAEPGAMPLVGHLVELRNRLVIAAFSLVPGTVLGFVFVVRPAMQMLKQRLATSAVAKQELGTTALTELASGRHQQVHLDAGMSAASLGNPESTLALPPAPAAAQAPVVPLMENYDLPPPGSPVDVMVDHLKVLAGKEPERVAEVVKQWVQKHERTQ